MKDLKGKIVSFNAKLGKLEKFSSQFHKVKIYVAYHGKNRNGTHISKETFENKLIPTIYGIPIVGEWKEEKEDFGSHGGKLEISDEGVKFIETTKPYGFIDSSAKVDWEIIQESSGLENEYLTVDGYVWSARYPEVLKTLDGQNNHSMEIEVFDGSYRDDDYFDITNGEFSALCILGEDVEPCFESSKVSQFSLDKESFKEEFSLMVKELKSELNFEGGEMLKDEEKVVTTEEEKFENESVETDTETVDDQTETFEDETVETDEDHSDENSEDSEEEFGNDESKDDETETETKDEDFESETNDDGEVKEEFEKDEEVVDYAQLLKDLDEVYSALKDEYKELEEKLDNTNTELEALREFKANHDLELRKQQEEELFNAFAEKVNESDLEELRSNSEKMSLSEIEKELYVLAGKKVISFNFKKNSKSIIIPVNNEEEKVTVDEERPYGYMFEEKK